MAGPLKNARWERFAQNVAMGMTGRQAYRTAGYDAQPRAADASAAQLLAKPTVRARVDELLAAQAEKTQITAEMIATEAWKIARHGKVEVARVSALTLLSKRHKEFSEKHVVSGDPEQPVIIERRTRSTR